MSRHAPIPLFLLLLAACGDDNPVAPDKDLVGTWVFDSTDMVDVLVEGMEEFLEDELDAAVDRGEIDEIDRLFIEEFMYALIDVFRAEGEDAISGLRFTVRFNADGSFEDDEGSSGTWRVDGNTLIMVEDGDEERAKYFVDGNDLTLIFSSEMLLDVWREDEDLTDEEVEALEEVFGLGEDINFRLFYKRK